MTLAEWRAIRKSAADLVRAASTLQVIDGLSTATIGLAPVMWRVPDADICAPTDASGRRKVLLYVNVNPATDRARAAAEAASGRPAWNAQCLRKCTRDTCVDVLSRNGFDNVFGRAAPHRAPAEYIADLRDAEFVASPEGNGVDCHRTYEALVCGAVPVVERAHESHLRRVYGNVPMLFTDNYSEITSEYLRDNLARLHSATYDWSRLHASQLSRDEQAMVRYRRCTWQSVTHAGTCEVPGWWDRARVRCTALVTSTTTDNY